MAGHANNALCRKNNCSSTYVISRLMATPARIHTSGGPNNVEMTNALSSGRLVPDHFSCFRIACRFDFSKVTGLTRDC